MKFFGASNWKNKATEIRTIDSVLSGFKKLRQISATTVKANGDSQKGTESKNGVITYSLSPDFIKTFAMSGLPFLTFYEYNNLTGWCRDTYFAPDHVSGYRDNIGKTYTIWTHDATSAYRRHIFLDDISKDITISFEVPHLSSASWFPLRIRLYDHEGVYFQHDQKLVVERITQERSMLTSWKKIPQLKDVLPRLNQRTYSVN